MQIPFVHLLLLLLPFFPGQNGKENVFTEWPADIISVWEGDSINITCSKNSSENEVGTYLKTSRPPANIVYISSRNTSFIHPNFTNRITYLNEGPNLTITVHNVRESDSNTYLCTNYITKNDRHIMREWMSVTVVVKAKTNGVIEQSPLSVRAQQGESISITCVLKSSFEDEWVVLLKTHMQPEKVFYVSSQNTTTIFPTFANRLEYSKQEKKLVITLHNLQENDTDVYACAAGLKNSSPFVNESGTMVLVKGGKQTECSIGSLAIYTPTIVVGVLLLSAVIFYILNSVNVKKKFFQKKKTNVVYEDMSFSSRSNTLVRTNTYSADN
ncbi:T-cell antigen CD7 [Tympanuchus pallidicinctus]|uniref:T-cell antigen CD7 n=1 Tax=Tympanuchus pallidicinctus TaxID=109042 RepID=UPI00228734F7|nr:T-cell antigen CD7 [Tympanuchus pallidicinctus]